MNINEMMQKDFWDANIPDFAPQAWEQGYQMGANAILIEVEKAMSEGFDVEDCMAEGYRRGLFKIAELKGGEK